MAELNGEWLREFQPTSPRGGRPCCEQVIGVEGNFNPRPHAGDDRPAISGKDHHVDFNPRPHAGDDGYDDDLHGVTRISTHVPTRGTTTKIVREAAKSKYFNPRPHAGDDAGYRHSDHLLLLFQPTSPRGGRLAHNPTSMLIVQHFNPRPHAGDDYEAQLTAAQDILFQPTSPRGGRRWHSSCRSVCQRFQPTSPRGGRLPGRSGLCGG